MADHVGLLGNLAICLTIALVLGYITQRLKLSPIVGYLLAGIALGPWTPGIEADQGNTAELAEIGVVLLMFGVGMHFDLRDLYKVRWTAVPGAVVQVLLATLVTTAIVAAAGWGWAAGLVMGIAISVASTVVLIRNLSDNQVLESEQGHIAVGWLIVEDLLTVLVLVMLPVIATATQAEEGSWVSIVLALVWALAKIALLAILVLWVGRKFIPFVLQQIARTRTRELFTLAILAVALAVATGSATFFGVSMALGAFLAGMVVGQSEVSHQAAADAIPMRDAFAVLFFVSVGMLFDPHTVRQYPVLFASLLAVILIVKPLGAIAMVWLMGYSFRTALTVAVGLAQIGEFSFILAELAADPAQALIPGEGTSLLVACAIVSITLNPLMFRAIEPLQNWINRRPWLRNLLSKRSEDRLRRVPPIPVLASGESDRSRALIIGYGPVGKTAAAILKDFGLQPVIVDLNVDTVLALTSRGQLAVYGDAAQREILEAAGVAQARYLLITIPDLQTRTVIVLVAREMNPDIKVFVRARYLQERAWLEEIGATEVCYEEAEAAIGLATLLLHEVGADDARIRLELRRIRTRLAFQSSEQPAEPSS